MTEPRTTSLREAALAAYAEQQRRDADNRAEERRSLEARVRRRFKDDFDAEPGHVSGNVVQPTRADPLTLRLMSGAGVYADGWQVEGQCPQCLEDCWSRGIVRDLTELGRLLTEPFETETDHHCPEPATRQLRQPTAAERVLLEALRNWRKEAGDDQRP